MRSHLSGLFIGDGRLENIIHELLLLAFLSWDGSTARCHNRLGLSLGHLIDAVLHNLHDLIIHRRFLAFLRELLELEHFSNLHLGRNIIDGFDFLARRLLRGSVGQPSRVRHNIKAVDILLLGLVSGMHIDGCCQTDT